MSVQKAKSLARNKTQEVRTITTSLMNKEEVFKTLALAESSQLPVLLEGRPGVGKTKTVVEYAKAWLIENKLATAENFMSKIYILETDEGTKQSEVKGMPDLEALFTNNKYELNAPITEAEIIIINEVDKASSGIRNSLLGIMNERFLFNGKNKVPCKWKLFVATCNEIPKDEINSPFWDRFMIKMQVSRISAGDMVKYHSKGGKDYIQNISLNIPNSQELKDVVLSPSRIEKFIEVSYDKTTDRTLTFVPRLAAGIHYIWDVSLDKALVKLAEMMVDKAASTRLNDMLTSMEMKIIMSKIDMLKSYHDQTSLSLAVKEIEDLTATYISNGKLADDDAQTIDATMTIVLENHVLANQDEAEEELASEILSEIEGDMSESSMPLSGTIQYSTYTTSTSPADTNVDPF
jgi:hypothetical protein